MESPPPETRVRRASMEDLDTLAAFNAAIARETEGKSLEDSRLRAGVAAVLSGQDRGFYLVAEQEGRVIGQLLVTFEWSDWRNAYFWWIQSVYVKQGHRRQGVYRALDAQVRDLARQQGNVCGVRLYVDQENRDAQEVYRRLGMRPSTYYMYELEFDP